MLTKLQISQQEEEIRKRFSPILYNSLQRRVLISGHTYASNMQTPKPVHTSTPEEEAVTVVTNQLKTHLINYAVGQLPVGHSQPENYADFSLQPPRVVQK